MARRGIFPTDYPHRHVGAECILAAGAVTARAVNRESGGGLGHHRAGGGVSGVLHPEFISAGRPASRRTYILGAGRLCRSPSVEASVLVLAGSAGERNRDPGSASIVLL